MIHIILHVVEQLVALWTCEIFESLWFGYIVSSPHSVPVAITFIKVTVFLGEVPVLTGDVPVSRSI